MTCIFYENGYININSFSKKISIKHHAINLLEKNRNKIDWCNLLENPGIFELDYKRIEIILEDLMKVELHPNWIKNSLICGWILWIFITLNLSNHYA